MLKLIDYTNLRSPHQHFELPRHVAVFGKNGAGKSSLKEAVVFALTGRDSLGSRSPKHLAQNPDLPVHVTIETAKGAKINRVLRPGGGQEIQLLHGPAPRTLTQKEFEGMLSASADLILSAILPGYFLAQSHVTQAAILAELAGPMNRLDLVEELLGRPVPERFHDLLKSERSNMAVEAQITGDRRTADKQVIALETTISNLETEISKLEEFVSQPIKTVSRSRLAELEEIRAEHSRHKDELTSRDEWEGERYQAEKKLKELNERREALEQKRLKLGEFDSSATEREHHDKLKNAYHSLVLPPPPPAPPILNVIEEDHCATCGQTVGLKHKQAMRVKNREMLEDFQKAHALWEANEKKEYENRRLSLAMDIRASEQLIKEAESNERLITRWKEELTHIAAEERQLKKVLDKPEPQLSPRPEKTFSKDEYESEMIIYQEGLKKQGVIEQEKTRLAESTRKIEKLREQLSKEKELQSELVEVEKAMKGLSALKLQKLKDLLSLPPPYILSIGEKAVELHDDREVPYGLFSTGEKMKVDVHLCLKITAQMKRPLNIILLDDAELMDDRSWLVKLPVQTFMFIVEPDEELRVESSELLA